MGKVCSEPEFQGRWSDIAPQYINIMKNVHVRDVPKSKGDIEVRKLKAWLKTQANENPFIDSQFPYKSLMKEETAWKRVSQILPQQPYKSENWLFSFQQSLLTPKKLNSSQPIKNEKNYYSFRDAMNELKIYPELLEQICIDTEIFSHGLYQFFFHPNGEQNQIIIDDFVPIDENGRYLFAQPRAGSGIWMILMEKALAKMLGGYDQIRELSKEQIFAEITGFPSKSNYLNPQFSTVQLLAVQPKSSTYFEFANPDFELQLIIALWFSLKQSLDRSRQIVIVQIIIKQQQGQSFTFLPIRQQIPAAQPNMILITNSFYKMLKIPRRQRIIVHIHNCSPKDTIECNLVFQSSESIKPWRSAGIGDSVFVDDRQKCKTIAIKRKFGHLQKDRECSSYSVRSMWSENRGVFRIINLLSIKQKYTFKIKEQFKDLIWFEEQSEAKSMVKTAQPKQNASKSRCTFILIRAYKRDYQQFYTIEVEYVAN